MIVSSNYEEIDPVGTLVGQKGMRVKSVMDELF
jgi:transcription antitermination factor NusA-like protein